MSNLRSLAFSLCSAIRRSRAPSCAAFHCFPDRIIGKNRITSGRKVATIMVTIRAAATLVSYEEFTPSKAITAWGAKNPLWLTPAAYGP